MRLTLMISEVAFAAACIWLVVRVVNRKERWAKWTLVGAIIGMPVLYVASFGPACWIACRTETQVLPMEYIPIGRLINDGPQAIAAPFIKYAQAFIPLESGVAIPLELKIGGPVCVINRSD